MADFHHQQQVSSPQHQQQQNYFIAAQLQQQQQQNFGQQRPQSQPLIQQQQQQSPQQQQINSGGNSNSGGGAMTPMQHNFMAAQHHHQMQQHQIRSATPPHQQGIMQQRQQGFTHPGMLQQMRQQIHNQQQQPSHGSPQSQQQHVYHHQQGGQTVVRQVVVRPMSIASPHQNQQQNYANSQQQQQYLQYMRQSTGMQNNVIQVTSSSSSTNAAQAQLVHVQPSHQQPGSQIRQMLPPQNAPFRHNVVIQREQKAQQIIRYPSQSNPAMLSSSGKLSPQQEMHVLQQHFPGVQMSQNSPYSVNIQQQQQQRFITQHHQTQQQPAHVSIAHSQQQQMSAISVAGGPMGNGGGGQAQQMVFVTAGQQQQPHYLIQQQHPETQQQHGHQGNFTSVSHPSLMQQQHRVTPTIINGAGAGQRTIGQSSMAGMTIVGDYTASANGYANVQLPNAMNSGRTSVKQEQQSPVAMGGTTTPKMEIQQSESPNASPTAPPDIAQTPAFTSTHNTNTSKKKSAGKLPVKANVSQATQKSGNTNKIVQIAAVPSATSKPSPVDSSATDLIKASVTGQPSLKLLDREALEAFVKNVDPNEVLEDEVADAIQLIMDEFVDDIIRNSAELSKHRGSTKMEASDVRYVLARNLQMAIPSDSLLGGTILSNNITGGSGPPASKRLALMAHQQRMAMVDKTLKKL